MINQNSSQPDIFAWQNFLLHQGYSIVGTPDGRWGIHTETATKEFQSSQHLDPDGKVGTNTLAAAQSLGFVSSVNNTFPAEGLLDVVFDVSHHNESVDFVKAKNAGMIAVFHKATQSSGTTLLKDKMYHQRKNEAIQAGLLWGAYHFGAGGSGKEQANVFLDYVTPQNDTLLVLDYEPNTTHGETTMTAEEAAEFVLEIFRLTGKYPGIYSGNLLSESVSSPSYSTLTHCWLWKAQYGPVVHLPSGWPDFVFWQYTDGHVGPSALPVDGVGRCDREVFKGTKEELQTFWKNNIV